MGRLFEGVTFSFQTAIKEAAEKAAEEAAKEAKEKADKEAEEELKITRYIAKMLLNRSADVEIKKSLMKEFNISEEKAEEKYKQMIDYLEN